MSQQKNESTHQLFRQDKFVTISKVFNWFALLLFIILKKKIDRNHTILSTGGTFEYLRQINNDKVRKIEDITKFPEILGKKYITKKKINY